MISEKQVQSLVGDLNAMATPGVIVSGRDEIALTAAKALVELRNAVTALEREKADLERALEEGQLVWAETKNLQAGGGVVTIENDLTPAKPLTQIDVDRLAVEFLKSIQP